MYDALWVNRVIRVIRVIRDIRVIRLGLHTYIHTYILTCNLASETGPKKEYSGNNFGIPTIKVKKV